MIFDCTVRRYKNVVVKYIRSNILFIKPKVLYYILPATSLTYFKLEGADPSRLT